MAWDVQLEFELEKEVEEYAGTCIAFHHSAEDQVPPKHLNSSCPD